MPVLKQFPKSRKFQNHNLFYSDLLLHPWKTPGRQVVIIPKELASTSETYIAFVPAEWSLPRVMKELCNISSISLCCWTRVCRREGLQRNSCSLLRGQPKAFCNPGERCKLKILPCLTQIKRQVPKARRGILSKEAEKSLKFLSLSTSVKIHE